MKLSHSLTRLTDISLSRGYCHLTFNSIIVHETHLYYLKEIICHYQDMKYIFRWIWMFYNYSSQSSLSHNPVKCVSGVFYWNKLGNFSYSCSFFPQNILLSFPLSLSFGIREEALWNLGQIRVITHPLVKASYLPYVSQQEFWSVTPMIQYPVFPENVEVKFKELTAEAFKNVMFSSGLVWNVSLLSEFEGNFGNLWALNKNISSLKLM